MQVRACSDFETDVVSWHRTSRRSRTNDRSKAFGNLTSFGAFADWQLSGAIAVPVGRRCDEQTP
jgi:hypothetical protein